MTQTVTTSHLLNSTHQLGLVQVDPERLVLRLLEDSSLGPVLTQLGNHGIDISALVDVYLRDFVRMVYKPRSTMQEEEYRVGGYCINQI